MPQLHPGRSPTEFLGPWHQWRQLCESHLDVSFASVRTDIPQLINFQSSCVALFVRTLIQSVPLLILKYLYCLSIVYRMLAGT